MVGWVAAAVIAVVAAADGSAGPVVDVSVDEIRWDGRSVLRLDAGRIARDDLDGHVIRRLEEVARPAFREARRKMREVGGFIRAGVRAAPALAWGVVSRVILTLELAGADRVDVRAQGRHSVMDPRRLPPLRAVVAALSRHRGIKWSAYPTVWVTRGGYMVYTHPSGRIARDVSRRGNALASVLEAIRSVFPNERNTAIMAEDAVPFAELLRVRDLARALGFSDAEMRPGFFR